MYNENSVICDDKKEEDDYMVTHSSKDYLKNMSTEARKVVTSILSKKSNHTQLKKDVAEYYKLRDMSEKK